MNESQYLQTRQQLEKSGLVIMSGVIQSPDQSIIDVISQHMQQRDTAQSYIYDCSYVGKKAMQGVALTEPVQLIQKVMMGLDHEIARLNDKYKGNLDLVSDRIREIEASKKAISKLETRGQDTYTALQGELSQLQTKLLSKNIFKRFFEYLGGTTTTSLQTAKILTQEVKATISTISKLKK